MLSSIHHLELKDYSFKPVDRAKSWLIKFRLVLSRYAAASLVGSMALQGTTQIDAIGGPKLIKPLIWMLRNSGKELKYAAMRALHALSVDEACCTYIARVRVSFMAFPSHWLCITIMDQL